jgi:hypothetical protein
MMNDDLDYIYLAAGPHWRGGRLYSQAYQEQHSTPQIRSVELPATVIHQIAAVPRKHRTVAHRSESSARRKEHAK